MFEKIGFKIKFLAKICCFLGIIISVIAGISLIIAANELYIDVLVIVGIAVIILGSLISWVSSFLLYGFGELIDLNDRNNKLLKINALSKD